MGEIREEEGRKGGEMREIKEVDGKKMEGKEAKEVRGADKRMRGGKGTRYKR